MCKEFFHEFGTILNHGTFSHVINMKKELLDENMQLNSPVLIITTEPDKYNFLKRLCPDLVQEAKLKNVSQDILEEYEDYNFFYMEKMIEFNFDNEGVSPFVLYSYKVGLPSCMEEDISISEMLSDIHKYMEKTEPFEFTEINKKICKAIDDSLLALYDTCKKENFWGVELDLHCRQFLSYNGDIYCVDPAMLS